MKLQEVFTKKKLRENKLNKPSKKKDLSELIRVDYKKG